MNYLRERKDQLLRTLKGEKGQGLVEYALILVLISIVVIVMLTGVGNSVNNTFSSVNSALQPPPAQ